MYLERLALQNFRNLCKTELTWSPGFNVIWGLNAQGKTNLLEAIYLLGHLKSFRSARGHDLIQNQQESAWLGGSVYSQQVSHRLELALHEKGRNPKVDGKTVQRLSQFLGYLRPILFTPEEMGLIKGYPAGRRALLDRAILQTDSTYLDRVQEFERILRQRNQLLKKAASDSEIDVWSEKLASSGGRIRLDRFDYLLRFQKYLQQVYREISRGAEQVEIRHPGEYGSKVELQDKLLQQLYDNRVRERQLRQTLAGPHRDDPEFLIDDKPLRTFGSQGQQRSFLLAFKAGQVLDLEETLGDSPVLLLDDLASELDQQRQSGFFDFLKARQGQVFITTTHPANLGETVLQSARFQRVLQGNVVEQSP
jgi:DNA replication and repair protein RecF